MFEIENKTVRDIVKEACEYMRKKEPLGGLAIMIHEKDSFSYYSGVDVYNIEDKYLDMPVKAVIDKRDIYNFIFIVNIWVY